MKILLAIVVAAAAHVSGALAAMPLPSGHPDRAAIANALRAGLATEARFLFDHLRADASRRAAYVEFRAREASGPSGTAFVVQEDGTWRLVWAVAGGGATSCATLSVLYEAAVRDAADATIFSPAFREERTQAAAGARRGAICIGDILAGPQ